MKYNYEQITNKDGVILRGVVNTPDDFDPKKKYPAVIFYHGFTGDRNGGTWFRTLHAKRLTDQGYVTIRFDFSGTNESDGDFYDMTVSRELGEAYRIYDYVKTRGFVDKERIYLIGHSLGGVISTLIAYDVKPKAVILLAPASDMNNISFIKVMAQKKLMENGIEDENLTKLDLIKKFHDIKDFEVGGLLLHKNFWLDFIDIDIYGKAAKYNGNVLILRGTDDALVFRDANEKLQKAYPNAVYEEIDGADHSFLNYYHREIVMDKVDEFLKANN